jgi:hypothetical protein
MSKFRALTLVSLLTVAVAMGCSSVDQGAIDRAVSATLEAQAAVDTVCSSKCEPEVVIQTVVETVIVEKEVPVKGDTIYQTVVVTATPTPRPTHVPTDVQFRGKGSTTTEAFTVTTSPWTLSWEHGAFSFGASLYDAMTGRIVDFGTVFASESETTGSILVYGKTGTFYLDVSPFSPYDGSDEWMLHIKE